MTMASHGQYAISLAARLPVLRGIANHRAFTFLTGAAHVRSPTPSEGLAGAGSGGGIGHGHIDLFQHTP